MPVQHIGEPLTGPFAVPGGEARIHERGATITGQVGQIVVAFEFPLIGVPAIAVGDAGSAAVFDAPAITFQIGGWQMEGFLTALRTAFAERVALLPTARGGTPVPMVLGTPVTVVAARSGVQATNGVPVTAALQDRQLYDVAVRGDDGQWRAIAPHAVYYRSSWHDFGIAHITDIHVSRRIDYFPGRLEQLGRADAARGLCNWNDRFRGFIRYANYLHDRGLLDVILATGDIIDYLFEEDDDEAEGGNALFARKLLLGQWPSPTFQDVEELRVPIFIVGGNHDYRMYPYRLLFNLDFGIANVKEIGNYGGFRLSWRDALAVTRGDNGDDVPELSAETAGRAIQVDRDIPTFRKHLADKPHYVVRLGSHRIVMLDSGPDTGMPTGKLDLILYALGGLAEDKRTTIGGSPNCEGVGDKELKMVVDTLHETPDDGLFILGMHAPLFNPVNEEYPYYLRETQRAAQPDMAYTFLNRNGGEDDGRADVRRRHPTWFAASGDVDTVPYLKRGDSDDLLDYGVSRGFAKEVIRAIAGIGSRRKADVVLHGHIHRHVDFRIGTVDGEPAYHMDFYTQNFAHYYPTRFGSSSDDDHVAYVDIANDAPANNRPSTVPYDTRHKYVVAVPPYPTPLSSAADPRAWWAQHRPLVLQTEAHGPVKEGYTNLSGFRLLTVKNDVIARIDIVSAETLAAANYRIEWEKVITPDPQRSHLHAQRSLEFGLATAAGTPVGYVVQGSTTQNIIYRGSDNKLTELWRDGAGQRGYGDVTGAANAPAAAGDPSVYFDTGAGQTILPYRGTDGHVHTLYWTTGAPGHDNLSGSINAPKAAGDPVGYYTPSTTNHHVIYRGEDSHLHALYWKGAEAAGYENITAPANAPKAAGDPSPYLDTKRGTNIVVYRAVDGQIHSLYWKDGPSGHDALSGYARAPQANGDPVAYYTAHNDSHQVVYWGVDNHLHELWWVGEASVNHWDLTAAAGAPPAASDPAAYYNASANKKHVVYRGADGHVYDLSWTPGGGTPVHSDLTMAAFAQPAASAPSAFDGPTHQHVVYRGTDNRIHEIRWQEDQPLNGLFFHAINVNLAMNPGRAPTG